jgi:23S rRNA (guanosine2251-2'-O)-methyltransferase
MNRARAEAGKNTKTAVAGDSKQIVTGFHAIEECVRSAAETAGALDKISLFYSKPGPRVKKIIEFAQSAGIPCIQRDKEFLDNIVVCLPPAARDHRGIVLTIDDVSFFSHDAVDFDLWLSSLSSGTASRETVFILDSITDPYNIGAILRSADQFGISLVIMPEKRGSGNFSESEIIGRSSAGANAWVPVAVVPNLVRATERLKEKGFWIYGADVGGDSVQSVRFASRTAVVMGSEGSGIARLLSRSCDTIISIPTCGKIDSLNVSVAAGVLMYEIHRQILNSVQP